MSTEKKFVASEKAIQLVTGVVRFLSADLGVPTGGFLRGVDRSSFGNENIPIWERIKSSDSTRYPHYYVYSSLPGFFTGVGYSPSYHYQETYEKAVQAHHQNIEQGYESYMRGAPANADLVGNGLISRNLFIPDLFYGLMVAGHEPLHPFLKSSQGNYVHSYEVEEAIATALGYQVVNEFLKSDREAEHLADQFEEYREEEMGYFRFIRRAYVTLDGLYQAGNSSPMTRTQEQEAVMQKLREEYGEFFVDPNVRQSKKSKFNNAFLLASINHTAGVVVNDFFQKAGIDPIELIRNKKLRDSVISQIAEAVNG